MAGKGDILAKLEAAVQAGDLPRVRRLAERLRYRAGWIPGPAWRDRLALAGVEPWWATRVSLDPSTAEPAVGGEG